MDRLDCVVIGAGVIGIAAARALAQSGREVLILEAEDSFGSITSARNSGVIHAGIYYPAKSLKARHCVRGGEKLYAYCAERQIDHRRCGKLIVATSEGDVARLLALKAAGAANGVQNLQMLTAAEAKSLEPALDCHAALHSPDTGIVDSHAFMTALLADAEAAGAQLVVRTPVTGGEIGHDGIIIECGGNEPVTLRCRTVVNSAGLHAPAIARTLRGFPEALVPHAYFAKGCYFALSGRTPFTRLVYPVPVPGGLGIHLTLDLAGQARFGPNVHWIDAPEYSVDPADADSFYAEIRRYWPELPADALRPDYAGVRPKISAPGQLAADFVIQSQAEHGVTGLVNLFGIESPGLTSALSIADHIATLAGP